MTTPTPQPNTTEARTPTGELKDVGGLTPPVETSKVEDKPGDKPVAPVVPEKYELKFPDGAKLDDAAFAKASEIFKKHGMTNEAAQELINIQSEMAGKFAGDVTAKVTALREGWRNDVAADPEMAGKLDTIKADIGKALTQLPPEIVAPFREAMDFTGAGDHPGFVKAFWKMAQLLNEGKPAARGNPSPAGQTKPGEGRPSLAASMYPNLPN